jgi:hypothetical protein
LLAVVVLQKTHVEHRPNVFRGGDCDNMTRLSQEVSILLGIEFLCWAAVKTDVVEL